MTCAAEGPASHAGHRRSTTATSEAASDTLACREDPGVSGGRRHALRGGNDTRHVASGCTGRVWPPGIARIRSQFCIGWSYVGTGRRRRCPHLTREPRPGAGFNPASGAADSAETVVQRQKSRDIRRWRQSGRAFRVAAFAKRTVSIWQCEVLRAGGSRSVPQEGGATPGWATPGPGCHDRDAAIRPERRT